MQTEMQTDIMTIREVADYLKLTEKTAYRLVAEGKNPGFKGSNRWDDLRHKEGAKIKCGEKHFAVLAEGENPATYIKATSVDDMMRHG